LTAKQKLTLLHTL